MLTAARLVDGAREMQLLNRPGIAKVEFDIPLPATVEEVEQRTDTDGTIDYTAVHGSRAVAINLRGLDDDVDRAVAELGSFMHPGMRPYLCQTNTDWPDGERRLRLRANQGSAPQAGPLYPYARDVQAQWVAPDGIWVASSRVEFAVNADAGTAGRIYPMVTPRTYPSTMAGGLTLHANLSSTFVHHITRLYGPCVGPRITNETTGETLSFSEDLAIAAGEYLEVDTLNHTALLLSDKDASRLDTLNFLTSTWWRLVPGLNQIRYHPLAGVDAGCAAFVTYLPAWLWL